MKHVTVGLVGRALLLKPAVFGELFHGVCTVKKMVTEQPSRDNNWSRRTYDDPHILYWYDNDPIDNERVFCTYAGFYGRICKVLSERGLEVRVERRVDCGLGAPDLESLRGSHWRSGQKAVMAKLLAHDGGVIVCPTGFGKTYLMKQLAKAYPKAEIVITVPSKDIAKDIYNDLREGLYDQVGMVGGGMSKLARVTVAVTQSLHRCSKSASLVLTDECHSVLTEKYVEKFNRFYRAKMFGFTATDQGRSDGSDGLAEAIFGPQLADVTYQEAVQGGNVVQLEVRMYRVTKGPEVSGINQKAYADRISLWLNPDRNRLIADTAGELKRELGPEHQILIMVDKTEHAFALGQLLPDFAIVTGNVDAATIDKMKRRGSYVEGQKVCTSKDRDRYRKEFESHELKYAIATGIWSKGVDFRDLAALIRADGMASKIHSGQIPGRLSRLGRSTSKERGIMVDFIDDFSSNLKGRSMSRIRVYKKNGWDVSYHDGC